MFIEITQEVDHSGNLVRTLTNFNSSWSIVDRGKSQRAKAYHELEDKHFYTEETYDEMKKKLAEAGLYKGNL